MKKLIFLSFLSFFYYNLHGQNWQQFGTGAPAIYTLYLDTTSNTLYATGEFLDSNSDTIISPAYWDGTSWIPVGNFDFRNSAGYPSKLFVYDNTLYVGGGFLKSHGAPGDYILKLNNNTNSWDTLDFSPDLNVQCFYEYQTGLYIGGQFNTFGPLISFGVIMHKPPFWSTIPPFANIGKVESMTKFNNKLVIAGSFASDLTVDYQGSIIEWDGINILPMADGLDLDDRIVDLEVYDSKLYAAGVFLASNVNDGRSIVSWDGQSWNDVGGGIIGPVRALQTFDRNLYAAGSFTFAGGIPAEYIAKWDGFKWCSLGSSFNSSITDMCVYNNELIIVGAFTSIDGQNINHIAKKVGGNHPDSCQVIGIDEFNYQNQITIYPSLTHDLLIVKSQSPISANLKIVDLTGKLLHSLSNFKTELSIDISFLNNGHYFVIIDTNYGRSVKKFIKY